MEIRSKILIYLLKKYHKDIDIEMARCENIVNKNKEMLYSDDTWFAEKCKKYGDVQKAILKLVLFIRENNSWQNFSVVLQCYYRN